MGIFLVGGCRGAGAKALQDLLCQDPAAGARLPEGGYLRRLVTSYRLGRRDFGVDTGAFFDSVQEFREFNARLLEEFLEQVRRRLPGSRHLVLRDPELTPDFPALFELLPGARFLLMVRDPRDVVASLREQSRRIRSARVEHIFHSRGMRQLCQYVRNSYVPVLRHDDRQFRARVTVVRYEDLARSPAGVVAVLRGCTGLELAAEQAGETALAVGGESARISRPLQDRAAMAAGIGRYRNALSRSEIRLIEHELAEFMVTFGYG